MKKILILTASLLLTFFLLSSIEFLTLSTEGIEGVYGISSFFSNNEGEIFLFSRREGKVFKFKPDGKFDKSFCRFGQGPGEIRRVFFMFHNPSNDFLYLPEYVSGQKRVTVYDSEGNYKGTLKVDLPIPQMDKIWKIAFLEDGSFYIKLQERIGWKPRGKLFTTQRKTSIKYFNQKGDFLADIFTITMDNELSNGPRWGGPQILFLPSILMGITPEGNIIIAKTDDNLLTVFNKKGVKKKTIQLEISRAKLSDKEFQEEKETLVEDLSDPRMKYLARKMIKLDYKPIYSNLFLQKEYIILSKIIRRDESYYVKESELIYFDWKGKKLGNKLVQGEVLNIQEGKIYIKYVDPEGTEHFKIHPMKSIFS